MQVNSNRAYFDIMVQKDKSTGVFKFSRRKHLTMVIRCELDKNGKTKSITCLIRQKTRMKKLKEQSILKSVTKVIRSYLSRCNEKKNLAIINKIG